MTTNPLFPSLGAWDGTQFQVLTNGVFDPVASEAALAAYVAANPPPAPTVAPSAPAAPTAVYISKVEFERRLLPAEFGRLDALKIAIDQRPANWATSTTAPWPTYAPLVPAVQEYEDAGSDGVNVNDASFQAFINEFPALGIILASDMPSGALNADKTAMSGAQWIAFRIAALLEP